MNEQPKSVSFPARHGTISGLRWGENNAKKILALHGWLDNAASFYHLAPLIAAQGYQVTAIDFPGHGHSEHRAEGHHYGLIDYTSDVQAVVEQFHEPVIFLCHSMGAVIGQMYAAAYPEQVSKLIILETLGAVPTYQPGTAAQSLRKAMDLWQQHSLQHRNFYSDFDTALQARLKATPMPAAIMQPMVERGIAHTEQGYHWRTDKRLRLDSLIRISEQQVLDFLQTTTMPTLLIIGKPLTKVLKASNFKQRLRAIKHQKLCRIAGGHHLHMTHAKEVAQAVLKFLS